LSIPRTNYGYSRGHRAVEILAISFVLALLVGFSVRIALAIDTWRSGLALVATASVAYVATDVLSGVVHWAGDTIGNERIPFVGPNFIRPFREHHVDQKAITRHDFIETNGNNCIIVAMPLALAYVLMPATLGFGFFASSLVALMALFVLATNQFHKWAHADAPPAFARRLQRWGVILPPRHHDIHHAAPHDKHYCITVGWMNPLLNRIHFFRVAEALIARVNPAWLYIEERTRLSATGAAPGAGRTPAPRP